MKRNRFNTYESGKEIKGFWVKPEFVHLSGKSVNSVFPEFAGRNITDVVVSNATASAVYFFFIYAPYTLYMIFKSLLRFKYSGLIHNLENNLTSL